MRHFLEARRIDGRPEQVWAQLKSLEADAAKTGRAGRLVGITMLTAELVRCGEATRRTLEAAADEAELAAIAAYPQIGRGDEKAADQVAVDAMRTALNALPIDGKIVIGEGERDEAPMLYIGEKVGTGKGPAIDIALDPLEGTTRTAKAMANALTVLAMSPGGGMLHAPDVVEAEVVPAPEPVADEDGVIVDSDELPY
jgi:hypothetical protein